LAKVSAIFDIFPRNRLGLNKDATSVAQLYHATKLQICNCACCNWNKLHNKHGFQWLRWW